MEEAAADLRFLTIEEVKAAKAGNPLPEQETPAVAQTSGGRPQLPPMPLHHKRHRSLGYRLRKFRSKISFRLFKRRYASAAGEKFHAITPEEIKRANAYRDLSRIGAEPGFTGNREESNHQRRHKKRKKRSWISRIFRRKHKEHPVILIRPGEIVEEEKERAKLSEYIRPILNSTALFMIAYQLCWLLYQFAVMIVASFSNIDSVLFYYEVLFPIGNYSPRWNQVNIIFITLAGPFISLVMYLVYRFVLIRRFHPGAQMRTFLVWLYLNSMMLFFGAFVGGAITRQGFGYVVDWMFINVAFRILLSLIFLSIIIWISWKVVRFLPESSGLDSWKNDRIKYVASRLVIPVIIGGTIMILLKKTDVIPQHENIFNYDAFNIATLLFAVIPPMFNINVRPHMIQNKKTYPRVHRRTVAFAVIAAIALVLLVRIGLQYGMLFQLSINLNIGFYH